MIIRPILFSRYCSGKHYPKPSMINEFQRDRFHIRPNTRRLSKRLNETVEKNLRGITSLQIGASAISLRSPAVDGPGHFKPSNAMWGAERYRFGPDPSVLIK